jgi:hypothetical protein
MRRHGSTAGRRTRNATPALPASLRTPVALALLLVWPLLARGATFTAVYQQNPVFLGQSAVLELRFENSAPDEPPNVPPINGLTVGYTGQSQQFTIINGVRSHTLAHNYLLTPSRAGDYQLPAIQARIGGQVVAAQPPLLKVLPADADPREQQARQLAILRLTQPKPEVFVGEPFPVQVELLVQNAREVETPKFQSDGFTFGKMAPHTQDRVQFNGMIYNRVLFPMTAVAVKTGNLVFGPAQTSLTVLITPARRDPFDLFGQRAEARRVTLTSELHPVRVLPLPSQDMPPGFSGAVGSFSALTVEAGPTNVAVGDPITLKLRITGRGALDAVNIPGPSNWREFKAYPASAEVQSQDPLGLQGVKVIEQVVTPENAEVRELPAIEFSYFDPEKRAYQTLRHPPIALTVRPGSATAAVPTILATTNQTTAPPPPRDIIHIKPHPGTLAVAQPALVLRPAYWALNAVPAILCLAAWWWRRRSDELAGNPRLRRRLAVDDLIRDGLEELAGHAAAQDAAAFHATAFRLLQERIGERLDLPSAAITESVIEERLRPAGLPADDCERLQELFLACNQARYASSGGQHTDWEALTGKVRQALAAVEALPA